MTTLHKNDPQEHTIVTFYNSKNEQVSQYDNQHVNFGGLSVLHKLDVEKHGKLTYEIKEAKKTN